MPPRSDDDDDDEDIGDAPKALDETFERFELADEYGIVPNRILRDSGVEHKPNKSYIITHVYDTDRNKYISLNKAVDIGIINLNREEYIDSKTGNSVNLGKNKLFLFEINIFIVIIY